MIGTTAVRRLAAPGIVTLVGVAGLVAVSAALGAAAAQEPLFALALPTAAILAIAIARRPDSATLVVVAILYSNAGAIAVRLQGLPYFVGAAVPFLLVAPFAYHLVVRRRPVVITPALPLVAGFFLVQVVSALLSVDTAAAVDALVTFIVEGLLIYIAITNAVRTTAILRTIVWTLLIVGALIGALSVYQQVTETYANNYWGFAQVSQAQIGTGAQTLLGEVTQPRLAGPIGEKNRYAQIMLVLVPLGLATYWSERSRLRRAAAAVATTLIALGSILAFSRGAAIGFAIMLAIMVALRYVRFRDFALVAIGIAALLTVQPAYTARLASLAELPGAEAGADNSIRSRATEVLTAVLVFADHPVIGVGRGLFPLYYRQYADEVAIEVQNADRESHNLYAGIAAETGIIGLVAFIGILIVTLRDLHRARRRWVIADPLRANLATGFLLAVVSYMTTGLFLHLAYERYFWLLLALAGATGSILLRPDVAAAGADESADKSSPAAGTDRPALITADAGPRS